MRLEKVAIQCPGCGKWTKDEDDKERIYRTYITNIRADIFELEEKLDRKKRSLKVYEDSLKALKT